MWEKNCMLASHLAMEPQDCGDVKQYNSFWVELRGGSVLSGASQF